VNIFSRRDWIRAVRGIKESMNEKPCQDEEDGGELILQMFLVWLIISLVLILR